jgi:hypothetical protein
MNPSTRVIRSEDADAIEQLKAKIKHATQLQERMRTANAIIRTPSADEEKIARLGRECAFNEPRARELLKPDFAGRIGFPTYLLTNNAATTRRMEKRVDALGSEQARESVPFTFPGGRVEDSAEDCRVRIFHDAKPAPEVIVKLKSHGFHWTPSLKCWSRLRNEAARFAVTQVTSMPWPDQASTASLPATRPAVAASPGFRP